MRFLETYLISRIDKALDDGEPLTGLTRWFVQRNDRLRDYYESMLELEIELRFSDELPPSVPIVAAKMPSSVFLQRRLWYTTGTTVCLLFIAALFIWKAAEEQPIVSAPPESITENIAEFTPDDFQEMLAAVIPATAESLVDFSERPIELTSMLLSQVGYFVSKTN